MVHTSSASLICNQYILSSIVMQDLFFLTQHLFFIHTQHINISREGKRKLINSIGLGLILQKKHIHGANKSEKKVT